MRGRRFVRGLRTSRLSSPSRARDARQRRRLALIVLFNLVFAAPLLAVFLVPQLTGTRGRCRLERRRKQLDRRPGGAVAIVVVAIAPILTAVGSPGIARG